MRVTFEPTAFENSFGPYQAVLSLNSGDTLCTTTLDSRGRDGDMVVRGRAPNPLTGPFYVEGAEPGDALAVDLLSIRPNRAYGYSSDAVAAHVVDATAVTDLPERGLAEWAIDQAANTARLSSPIPALAALELPLSPMLGCIGVAPPGGQTISSATSGSYGGNMDYRGIVAGTTLMLPVSEPGTLLFVGDGHAVQGDGEIVGMGIEISMEVSLRVRVLKRLDIRCPRGISATSLFTLGNARPMEQALQHATTELLRWLANDYGLDARAASTLLGQCIAYDVGNVFDPAYTVAARIDRALLSR